jgi:hypothetical protein
VGPFLARLVRLDPMAPVRLRAAGPGRLALWGRLPWQVLATRRVSGDGPADVTVYARELLTGLESGERFPSGGAGTYRLPPARDHEWRWALPSGPGTEVETLPAEQLRRIGAAAARTLKDVEENGVAGRPVGSRVLRDKLLDFTPITVESGGHRIEINQRSVQGLLRMGFIGTENSGVVTVRIQGEWVGLGGKYGDVWHRTTTSLAIRFVL